jgi:hypothetical protein
MVLEIEILCSLLFEIEFGAIEVSCFSKPSIIPNQGNTIFQVYYLAEDLKRAKEEDLFMFWEFQMCHSF